MATRTPAALIADLADAVHGISSPFVCGGSLLLQRPVSLVLAGGNRFTPAPAPREHDQELANEPLVRASAPARFGKGRRTRYDRAVRDAVQLDAGSGVVRVDGFDPAKSGVLEQIRAELAPASAGISAELYAVNVYGRDGHFRPHKDTPRGADMLGTLVVCLPSRFWHGHLIVAHRGAIRVFDWGKAIRDDPDPERIHWAAFFGDVDHAIEPVWWGSRVTVTYLLRAGGARATSPSSHDAEALVTSRLEAALRSRQLMPKGGVLAFPCLHMYSQERRWQKKARQVTRRSLPSLKGRDQTVARAALGLDLEVTLHPYLVETCADETWPLERFPTDRERDALAERLDPWKLARSLPVAGDGADAGHERITWIEPPPSFNGETRLYRGGHGEERGPVFAEIPALEYLHACEYSSTGYFGNEGSDVELYVYAALHLEIPRWGEGPRSARPQRLRKRRSPEAGRAR
jgi:hypothetical protein